jgi:hypothetical protein
MGEIYDFIQIRQKIDLCTATCIHGVGDAASLFEQRRKWRLQG